MCVINNGKSTDQCDLDRILVKRKKNEHRRTVFFLFLGL
jgi:hypothetical protein